MRRWRNIYTIWRRFMFENSSKALKDQNRYVTLKKDKSTENF